MCVCSLSKKVEILERVEIFRGNERRERKMEEGVKREDDRKIILNEQNN